MNARCARLYNCAACGLVSQRIDASVPDDHDDIACPRCGSALHLRIPDSLQRTWACLAAALLLYAPANLLPILITSNVFGRDSHTILGGIVDLWNADSWGLALIVFIASIAVPILKIATLSFLAFTAQRCSCVRGIPRTHLYRLVEAVGHWSMLDVFVVVLLVGMVRFGAFGIVEPGPGLLAFGAVVVLTMLASASFDPRLLWPDEVDDNPSPAHG
jgi:paraquat-inducible protein A